MLSPHQFCCCFFFFNYPATPEIYPFSLPDALPISSLCIGLEGCGHAKAGGTVRAQAAPPAPPAEIDVTLFLIGDAGAPAVPRSEEHTSELQSRLHLVCRLLLEKKKKPLH